MTKTTQATIFRKRQILPARGLNKALQEYGSVDGVVPFKADGTQDTSMTAPLGTKAAPFGNAHFKGFNLYTQLEVQQMVENSVLGSADRFVFWNLDTNNLSAWNGTEIIHLGGNGGGSDMDYLFGDGSDGDVTMVANGNFDVPKNFKSFTLNAGVVLSTSNTGNLIVIRCQEVCKIFGTINGTGKGFPGSTGYDAGQITGCTYKNIGGSVSNSTASRPGGRGATGGGAGDGVTANSTNGNGGNFDYITHKFLAQQLRFEEIALMGGGGGSGFNPNKNQYKGAGGAGGTGILIFAPTVVFDHSTSQIISNGANGNYDSEGYGGGGGGAGSATIVAHSIVDLPTFSFQGGSRPTYNNKKYGYDGGTGGYITVII